MAKLNCWQFKKCGREPGGARARELGVCLVFTETRVNKTNGGRNGGRACWAISGTLCGGEVQSTFATKCGDCLECAHFGLGFLLGSISDSLSDDTRTRICWECRQFQGEVF